MKRAGILMAVLGMCAGGWAQGKPATQSAPSGQAAAAQGKRAPAAKTQPEFDAYKTAIQLTDAAAAEKAADDFAAKFPESELRGMLYKSALQKYQQSNNPDKVLEMAQKALTFDPDDPEALIAAAETLAERTRDTDLDRDQKLAEAKKDAERALATIDTDVPTTGLNATPEKIDEFKRFLRSEAYAILGTLASNAKNYSEAETNLRKSIEVLPEQVDPVAVLRLAIALDMQNKYPDALKYANQAVDLTKTQPDSAAAKAARSEQDRLTKLSSGSTPGQSTAPQKN
jgi:tetratricopeptide (TPR) repeat protein